MSDIHSPEPADVEQPAPPVPAVTESPAPPVTPPAAPPRSGIAVAALVLGIVAAVFAIIPGPSFGAFVPAIVATVLGIVGLIRKTPRRGFALAGIILGAIALVVAIIVSIVAIVAGAGLASRTSALSGGTGIASGSGSTSAAAKPTPAPTLTPTVAPVPADVVLSGHGDAVIKASAVDGAGEPGVATITHDGTANFAVWSLDANVHQLDLLVNTIGAYNGTVLFDKNSTEHTESLQITADGNWTVTLHSIRALRTFDATGATGHGDDVILYSGNAGVATITHDGSSNFAIWTYGDQSNLVVNEIGAYNGTVRWTKGPELVSVTADGNWSIAVQ